MLTQKISTTSKPHVAAFDLATRLRIEQVLHDEALDKLVRTIHEGKRVSFWWTMGVNQSHEGCALLNRSSIWR